MKSVIEYETTRFYQLRSINHTKQCAFMQAVGMVDDHIVGCPKKLN
ncbi:DNA-3-methyladenine glycosylase I [Vibrio harveyi]